MLPGFYPALFPFALLLAGSAQDVLPTPDPSVADPTTLALTEVSERMTVPVQIAGAGPYRFIIDTGSERTVISRQLATRLGLAEGNMVNVVAMSGVSRVGTVLIPSLSLSSVPSIGVIHAPALDANHLGGMGLLGIDTLQNHRITIDFEAGTMSVAPAVKRQRSEPRESGEIVVRARSLFGQLIVTDADVDGRQVRVVLDTGSPVSIGNAALRRLLTRHSGKLEPLVMTSATGGEVHTQYTRVDKLRVGGIEFKGMPIAFADVAPFERLGLDKKPAMLLGMNAMKFFRRVEIDFPNREVRFKMPRGGRVTYRCLASNNQGCTA